ncbi:MAG TPA: hypothetical protein VL171_15020 [Verrucomicrobiae bacterium]|nr:hypothetical protein [Verrucomicrobiae bacterium]
MDQQTYDELLADVDACLLRLESGEEEETEKVEERDAKAKDGGEAKPEEDGK